MERLEIIEALKDLPYTVELETGGVSEEVLRHRPAEGEWSTKEIIGHLRDMAEVWHKRIFTTWSLTDPMFPPFDGEESVRARGYQERDLAAIVAEMREWREKTVDVLGQAVDWTRLGQHASMGRRSLKQWAEYMVGHDSEHLASIRSLKEAQTSRQPS
jgi:DinB superfamily